MKHTSRRRLEDGNPFSCFLLFRFTREMKCCLDVIHKPCIRLSGPLCSLCRGRCESKTPLIWRSWRAGDQTGTHSVHYCCRLETPADCRTALMFDNLHCNWNFFFKKDRKTREIISSCGLKQKACTSTTIRDGWESTETVKPVRLHWKAERWGIVFSKLPHSYYHVYTVGTSDFDWLKYVNPAGKKQHRPVYAVVSSRETKTLTKASENVSGRLSCGGKAPDSLFYQLQFFF